MRSSILSLGVSSVLITLLAFGCRGGVVGGACADGYAECGGRCVSLQSDPNHCGACGNRCSSDRVCVQGACRDGFDGSNPDSATPDAADGDSSDGPTTDVVVDGPVLDGGDGSPTDVTIDGSEGGTDSNPCIPPYNTAEQCGDCLTKCVNPTPVCAPSEGTYKCISTCEPPLEQCGSSCVDLQWDPLNCGKCGKICPSGICQNGVCIGATVGHVVLMCMNFEVVSSSSMQTMLLGNSLFLSPRNPVRVLEYVEHISEPARARVRRTMDWAAQARGRTYSADQIWAEDDILEELSVQNYEVLLIHDQHLAPAGELAMIGGKLAQALNSFSRAGGTVLVLSGGGGAAEMDRFMTTAGLLEVTAETSVSGSMLRNWAPGDVVGVNVISPFIGLLRTCTFATPQLPGSDTTFVVGPEANGSTGAPSVVHRIQVP